MQTLNNVPVLPYSKAWIGGPDHSMIPDHGRIRCRDEFTDAYPGHDGPFVPLAGRWFYGGPMKHHFGHVLIDSVIRLHAYDPAIHQGVIFAALDKGPLPAWVWPILALFGVTQDRVKIIEAPSVIEAMDFAEPGSVLKQGPSPWYLDWLNRLPLEPRPPGPKRIYLGRTHILDKGALMGESYFSAELQRAGFEYVIPEKLDIHAQAAWLRGADEIVFAEGSSIYSMELLARSSARVFMIPRRRAPSLFAPHIIPRSRGFDVLGDIASIERRANRQGRDRPNSPSFCLAPETIHRDMVGHGLVRSRFDIEAFREAERADHTAYFNPAACSA